MTWLALVALALGTYALRAVGPVVVGERRLSRRVDVALTLTPVAILAALAIVQTLWSPVGFAINARVVGVLAAAVALWLRARFVVAVAVAMMAAAVVRALM